MRGVLVLVLLLHPLAAAGALFTVDFTADLADDAPGDGVCSTLILISIEPLIFDFVCTLRGAVQQANASAGLDEIVVPAGEFVLDLVGSGEDLAATGDLDLTDDVILGGAGVGATVIRGAPSGDRDRVLHVLAGAQALVRDLSIRDGFADFGGGIRNQGELFLVDVEVSDNVADGPLSIHVGGGIDNLGELILARTTVADNRAEPASEYRGGGIENGGFLIMGDSTVSGNEAEEGGAIFQLNGTMTAWNSTLSGNDASYGGAFYSFGAGADALFSNVTMTENTAIVGGGIFHFGGGIDLQNSIVSGNQAIVTGSDCAGAVRAGAYNLWGDTNGCTFSGGSATDLVGPSGLGPLQDNGGATLTHLPDPASLAVEAGDPLGCFVDNDADPGTPAVLLPADQRGEPRPSGVRCDIGAVELPEPRGGWLAGGLVWWLGRSRKRGRSRATTSDLASEGITDRPE